MGFNAMLLIEGSIFEWIKRLITRNKEKDENGED